MGTLLVSKRSLQAASSSVLSCSAPCTGFAKSAIALSNRWAWPVTKGKRVQRSLMGLGQVQRVSSQLASERAQEPAAAKDRVRACHLAVGTPIHLRAPAMLESSPRHGSPAARADQDLDRPSSPPLVATGSLTPRGPAVFELRALARRKQICFSATSSSW